MFDHDVDNNVDVREDHSNYKVRQQKLPLFDRIIDNCRSFIAAVNVVLSIKGEAKLYSQTSFV
jgi:hypothetical protein